MSTSERDSEICTSILRGLESTARDCEQLAADYSAGDDTDSAIDMRQGALTALTANATADPETQACDTQELPRVH